MLCKTVHTRVESWLQCGKTIVLEHVEKGLLRDDEVSAEELVSKLHDDGRAKTPRSPGEIRTVLPALSRPRKRILAFLWARPVARSQKFMGRNVSDENSGNEVLSM